MLEGKGRPYSLKVHIKQSLETSQTWLHTICKAEFINMLNVREQLRFILYKMVKNQESHERAKKHTFSARSLPIYT